MTIGRILFRLTLRVMERRFLRRSPSRLYTSRLDLTPVTSDRAVDVVTIAFNNERVIALHNRYVSHNLKGDVTHIVVDNSSDKEASLRIRRQCETDGVAYVRLHRNSLGRFSGSYSHAAALNWTYRHVIMPRRAFAFGFIDHDIFPVTAIDIASLLERQPLYGAQRRRGDAWYLSAIVCFLRRDLCEGRRVDFMPVRVDGVYLDSGGANWYSIYRHLDAQQLHFVSERMENFREGSDRHQDQVELFDDGRWVHTINGSYWKKIAIEKESLLEDLVLRYAAAIVPADPA